MRIDAIGQVQFQRAAGQQACIDSVEHRREQIARADSATGRLPIRAGVRVRKAR